MPAAPDGLAYGARLARHYAASAALALLSDAELADLLDAAQVVGAGIGGVTARLDVGGTAVFVKRIPLTDLERRPEHVRSTANLHGQPAHCQYGIVSPGFGAWRELAANTLATNWVLAGRNPQFPLMYHWRESAFLAHHATHDAGYVRMRLVNWLVQHVVGVPVPADGGPIERNAYIRDCARGRRPEGVAPGLADMVVRHAPVAAVMNDFYRQLFDGVNDTPYPADEVARALTR